MNCSAIPVNANVRVFILLLSVCMCLSDCPCVCMSVCVSVCLCVCQHANEDVEKMILGNKCDMEDKRQVSRERGEAVCVTASSFRFVYF